MKIEFVFLFFCFIKIFAQDFKVENVNITKILRKRYSPNVSVSHEIKLLNISKKFQNLTSNDKNLKEKKEFSNIDIKYDKKNDVISNVEIIILKNIYNGKKKKTNIELTYCIGEVKLISNKYSNNTTKSDIKNNKELDKYIRTISVNSILSKMNSLNKKVRKHKKKKIIRRNKKSNQKRINFKINGNKQGYSISKRILYFFKPGEYFLEGNFFNHIIQINFNNVILYFKNASFNSNRKRPTISIKKNIKSTIIDIRNSIFTNSRGYPIFKLSKKTNLIFKAKSSFLKGRILFSGDLNYYIKIDGELKFIKNKKYVKMKEYLNVNGGFNFLCDEEKIFLKELTIHFSPQIYYPTKNYFDIFQVTKNKISTNFGNKIKCKIQNKEKNFFLYKEKVILTMTSWKPRIKHVYKTLEILINNSVRPNKVILNLAIDEFPKKNAELPKSLLNLLKYDNFEIYWVKENTNVFKKLMPTLNRFKNDIIMTVDDDVRYPYDLVENTLKEFLRNKQRNPMCFGGLFSYWAGLHVYSHFGPCSIVKYKFLKSLLFELYNNTTVERIRKGIKCYDDLLYTYAVLLNGYRYKRGRYSMLYYYKHSPKLKYPFSEHYRRRNKIRSRQYHSHIRNYIIKKYNRTIRNIMDEQKKKKKKNITHK